ncbi:MAG: PEP-CTERM sorting domain-containing protein [Aureliella sp.]
MFKRFALSLSILLLAANVSSAGFEIGFTFNGGSPMPGDEYDPSLAGTTVTETLYLQATGADTLAGLLTFQMNIAPDVGGTTISNFTPAAGWTTNENGAFTGGLLSGTSVGVASGATAPNRVDLGQISFVLGPVSSLTEIGFEDTGLTPGTVTTGADVLDGSIFPGGQFVAVPEPSSLGIMSCLALAGVARRRRRC